MTISPAARERLRFLARVVSKEIGHLQHTDGRLFRQRFSADAAAQLAHDPDLAERVDAFVTRFGRLQDTIGDMLLPALPQGCGLPAASLRIPLDRDRLFRRNVTTNSGRK